MALLRGRRFGWTILLAVTVLAGLALAVFPIQDLVAQRRQIGAAEQQLEELRARNAEMEARIAALETPSEVERLAREEYNLVYPGEEAYSILPLEVGGSPVPPPWPFR